jgi:NADPH:quinone reductase
MRAWRVHDVGEPEDVLVFEDVDEPTTAGLADMGMSMGGWVPLDEAPYKVTPDFAILEMRAAALALPDVTMASGTYPVPVPHPYITGQEGVGIVREASPALAHLVGTRVVGVCIQPWGSLADVAVAVAPSIVPAPEALDDVEAAAFLIPAHTGYHVVIRRGHVQAGETVLVTGAAGGLGSACVQLAAAQGARVLATVGSAAKAQHCLDLGADDAVDHSRVDIVEGVRALVGDRGLDVIIDPVQGADAPRVRTLLAPDGRHVLCGHAGGLEPIDPHFYVANVTLVGATLGGYPPTVMREMFDEANDAVVGMLDAGTFRVTATRVVELDDVPRALAELAARRTLGRTVVRISDG